MTSITPSSLPPRGPFSEQATFTPSPETSPRPIGAFDSCLGKRKFAEGDWFPGAGIPFYSFGYENDSKAKLYRTSILFTELKVNYNVQLLSDLVFDIVLSESSG